MSLILDGSVGVSDVDGSAATPAIRGTDANTGMFFPAADTIAFSEGGVESMRINSSGNVGIGPAGTSTNTVSNGLAINNATAGNYPGLEIQTANTTRLFLNANNAESYISSPTNPLVLITNSVERMRITSAGDVGIGTTSPNEKLGVAGAIASTSNASNFNQAKFLIDYNSGSGRLSSYASGGSTIELYTNASGGNVTERMRITSNGVVLIGTTNEALNAGVGIKFRLDTTAKQISVVSAESTNGGGETYVAYSTGAAAYRFYVGWGGTVYATSATITSLSDQRLKENIVDLNDGLNAVMALKPRKFDWKEGKGKNIKGDRGFIAQEFETVFPDMVEESKDTSPKGEEPYKAVNANLIPTLVKAIQELKAELDSVKAELQTLKGA
jgi:trimeric autotransporter adhesin